MTITDQASGRARELREAFDTSFAEEPSARDTELVDFLIVTSGAGRYAVRLEEVAAVHGERKVTRVVSPLPELLGLADFRGVLTPIYSISTLLGRPSAVPPRFLVVARHARPIGFAFEGFERHIRLAPSELAIEDSADDPFTRGALRLDGTPLRILQLTLLVDHLARRLESLATKER